MTISMHTVHAGAPSAPTNGWRPGTAVTVVRFRVGLFSLEEHMSVVTTTRRSCALHVERRVGGRRTTRATVLASRVIDGWSGGIMGVRGFGEWLRSCIRLVRSIVVAMARRHSGSRTDSMTCFTLIGSAHAAHPRRSCRTKADPDARQRAPHDANGIDTHSSSERLSMMPLPRRALADVLLCRPSGPLHPAGKLHS